jgi:hypothetical protein
MLGESEKPILPHPRSAESLRAHPKRFHHHSSIGKGTKPWMTPFSFYTGRDVFLLSGRTDRFDQLKAVMAPHDQTFENKHSNVP